MLPKQQHQHQGQQQQQKRHQQRQQHPNKTTSKQLVCDLILNSLVRNILLKIITAYNKICLYRKILFNTVDYEEITPNYQDSPLHEDSYTH